MLALLAIAAAHGAPLVGPTPDFRLEVEDIGVGATEMCWPSGLRVTVQYDDRAPIASVTTVVEAGFADAPAGAEELPHLLEHLWFRAQPDARGEVANRLFREGAIDNAYTELDATSYVTVAPITALPDLLALEAARLRDPLVGVDATTLAHEKEVVRSELVHHWGSGEFDAYAVLRGAVFPATHPYHSAGSGTVDTLDGISLTDLSAFAKERYVPARETIAIVGYVRPAEVRKQVEDAFGDALLYVDASGAHPKAGDCAPPPRATTFEPSPPAVADAGTVTAPVDRTTVLAGWSLPPSWQADEIQIRLAVALLDAAAGRAEAALGDRGLLSASCDLVPARLSGMAVCALTLDRADADKAIAALRKEVDRTWTALSDADPQAWDRARARAFGGLFRSFEETPGPEDPRSIEPVLYSDFTGSPSWQTDEVGKLDAFDLASASAFGASWLPSARMVVVRVAPAQAGTSVASGPPSVVPPIGSADGSAALPDLADPPELATIASMPDLSAVERSTLGNGMRVVALPYGDAPVVHVALRLAGGWATEPRPAVDDMMWQSLAFQPLPNGVRLADAVRAIAGHLDLDAGPDSRTLTITASSGNVDDAMFLLAWVASTAYVDAGLWAQAHDAYGVWSGAEAIPAGWSAWDARVAHFAGGTPLAESARTRVSGARAVEVPDLERWRKTVFRPETSTIYIVGHVDPNAVITDARGRFGAWEVKGKATATPPTPMAAAAPARHVEVFDESRAQAEVVVACPIVDGGPEGQEVLADVAEQLLWTRVRDAGLTYTPWARVTAVPGAAALEFGAEVAPDKAGEVVNTLLGIVGTVADGAPAGLVAAVKVHDAADWASAHRTGDVLLSALAAADQGSGFVVIDGRAEHLGEVDAASLSASVASCKGHEIVTVVGPQAVIAASIAAAPTTP